MDPRYSSGSWNVADSSNRSPSGHPLHESGQLDSRVLGSSSTSPYSLPARHDYSINLESHHDYRPEFLPRQIADNARTSFADYDTYQQQAAAWRDTTKDGNKSFDQVGKFQSALMMEDFRNELEGQHHEATHDGNSQAITHAHGNNQRHSAYANIETAPSSQSTFPYVWQEQQACNGPNTLLYDGYSTQNAGSSNDHHRTARKSSLLGSQSHSLDFLSPNQVSLGGHYPPVEQYTLDDLYPHNWETSAAMVGEENDAPLMYDAGSPPHFEKDDSVEVASEQLSTLERNTDLPGWYLSLERKERVAAWLQFIKVIQSMFVKASLSPSARRLVFESLLKNGKPDLIHKLAQATDATSIAQWVLVKNLLQVRGERARMPEAHKIEIVKRLQTRMNNCTYAEAAKRYKTAVAATFHLRALLSSSDKAILEATIPRIPIDNWELSHTQYGEAVPPFRKIFKNANTSQRVVNKLMKAWGENKSFIKNYLLKMYPKNKALVLQLQSNDQFGYAADRLRPSPS